MMQEDIVRKWAARAKRLNIDVSKLIMGDKLYDQIYEEEARSLRRKISFKK